MSIARTLRGALPREEDGRRSRSPGRGLRPRRHREAGDVAVIGDGERNDGARVPVDALDDGDRDLVVAGQERRFARGVSLRRVAPAFEREVGAVPLRQIRLVDLDRITGLRARRASKRATFMRAMAAPRLVPALSVLASARSVRS